MKRITIKNLFLYTKMRNVAGLSTSDAQKSSDMFAKCRYMDEMTGNRGVIFATGTPVSNSMTELYTMQRYLQYDRLQELNMTHFDCWASRFGETVTALELAPEGTGYRARTRFSKFFNLPELMNLFREVADIKTADQLHLPTPQVEYHNVVAQPTEHQKEMVQVLSERAPPGYTAAAWTPQWTICSRSPATGASWGWTNGSSTSCCRMSRAQRSINVWTSSCRSGGTAMQTS